MSLLQNEEFIIYNLRSSYLNHIPDGVGERLITINQGVFNTPGFRAAGWQPSSTDVKRTYSPPIPTGVTLDYFQAPPRSAGHPPPGFTEDEEEGGIVTGGGVSEDTVGPTLNLQRRRRRKEQLEEEDSSDLSDESEEDGDATQRAAQQIRFSKMPVRMRSGSSPIRNSAGLEKPAAGSSTPQPLGGGRTRRGSLSAVEALKERARRGTTTSSDFSSENDSDPSFMKNKAHFLAEEPELKLSDEGGPVRRQNTQESTDLDDEESASDSDGSGLSSELTQPGASPSTLDDVAGPAVSSPLQAGFGLAPNAKVIRPGAAAAAPTTAPNASPKRTRAALAPLQTLPSWQPIPKREPVSALSQAIQAKRSKAASPFERFATLSGKGESNPLHLKIYAPFSERPSKPFEVAIRRSVQEGGDRKITVVDTIGFSLWRYAEESIAPAVVGEKMNVNRWMLRMVEDGEVDYDFPPLDRTKPMNDFASNNNRAARMRSNSKVFDEFALVEASDEEFKENETLTPNPPESRASAEEDDDPTPQPSPWPVQPRRWNPILGHDFSHHGSRNNSVTPADLPVMPASHATQRKGPSKILRIHLVSAEGYPELVALDVTTDTYLAEVLTMVCRKRNLDKAHHILRVSNTSVIAPLDRTVESLGDRADLDIVRRRFGNDGSLGNTTPGSTPPNAPLLITEARKGASAKKQAAPGGGSATTMAASASGLLLLPPGQQQAQQQQQQLGGLTLPQLPLPLHPLAQAHDNSSLLLGGLGGLGALPSLSAAAGALHRRYTVWRRQPMSFMPTHERVLVIDGECLHIMPAEAGKSTLFDSGAKTATIHFSSIVGCKGSRKHPSHFRVVVYKARESKRYDFEAQSAEEAAEIVHEITKAVEPFQGVTIRL